VRTWNGDLIVRIMPSGPAGTHGSTFTLYDGTYLGWNGSALQVDSNPKPRSVEVRFPDGSVVVRQIDVGSSTIA